MAHIVAGMAGLEPTKCQNQNWRPADLAVFQYGNRREKGTQLAGLAGLEPTECQSQNLVPYQLGYSPISFPFPDLFSFIKITRGRRAPDS